MKITLSAAMRARDVSRPREEDESPQAVLDEGGDGTEAMTRKAKRASAGERRRSGARPPLSASASKDVPPDVPQVM